MKRVIFAAPATYPVTLQQLKEHVGILHNDDDTLLTRLVYAACDSVERLIWAKLVTQTWDFYFDGFPDKFRLPFPPCQSITSVKYYDTAGTLQTLASSVYELGDEWGVGVVRLKYAQSWPSCRGHFDDVVIRAVVGYGAESAVPPVLKLAVCEVAANAYEFRETILDDQRSGGVVEIPQGTASYLAQYSFAEAG